MLSTVDTLIASAKNIIANSHITFGTSGARGLVKHFTPEVCAAFTLAFLSADPRYKRLAIAIDNRPSSPKIAADCIVAAESLGIVIDYYGVIPTPALAVTSMYDGIPAIMVTGSHIPFDRNGLKFYRPNGEITKADERAILSAQVDVPVLTFTNALPVISLRAAKAYIARNVNLFSNNLLSGKRIGIYEHSSAGRDLYAELFQQLGAETISLGRSDQFVPIDTEAVAQSDIKQAQRWQQVYNLDAIFSTDGDGDRPLLADETGTYLRGDILCLLAAQYLQIDGLAIPVSCNSAIERCHSFSQVERTKIGSPYVIEAFDTLKKNYPRVAGFEANGGFLVGSELTLNQQRLTALPTRDAILPVLAVLALAGNATISSLLSTLPNSFTASDRLQHFSREQSLAVIEQAEFEPQMFLDSVGLSEFTVIGMDKTDGVRLTLNNDAVVHLRPSGNAPELRCYVETNSQASAEILVSKVLTRLNERKR